MKKDRTWFRHDAVVLVNEDQHRGVTIITLSTGGMTGRSGRREQSNDHHPIPRR